VNRSWLMDNVSVVENSLPYVELLENESFEDSTVSLFGWQQWCSSYCHYGTKGKIISGADCYLGSGNCFQNSCLGPYVEFIGQFFWTNPGSNYTITFELALTGSGGVRSTMFYADIF